MSAHDTGSSDALGKKKKKTCAPLLIVRPLDQIEEDVQELISFFRLWVKASGAKDERDQLLGGGEKQKQRRSQIRVLWPRALMRGWEDEKEVGEDGSKPIKGGQLLELGCPHK